MIIDPRFGMWISIVALILSGLTASATQLTDIFGPDTSKRLLAVLAIGNTIINAVNAALHAMPASTPSTKAAASEFALGPNAKV